MWGKIKFSQLIIIKFLIFMYLNHPKINSFFALNFDIMYLFESLILVEVMKHLDVIHHKDIMF